ncbi:MAG: D-glycero-beta-D-manno-heptose 1-phosphate adenylyltransferase [Actinomycetota bacterium]|nr:D-glycero-beta-D-manno-heptose 1-phosphate adenylyltransferase [Actinomycetota bacterium]
MTATRPASGQDGGHSDDAARHIHDLTDAITRLDTTQIRQWGQLLAARLSSGGHLLVCGNGGSAAQASHLAAELTGRYDHDRAPLGALALADNAAILTAVGNDFGFEEVFARQVLAHGRPGDVLLLLSTSAASTNVVRAARTARDHGLLVWALTGPTPHELALHCDSIVSIPATRTSTVQECHLVAIHLLCAAIDAHLTGRTSANPTGDVGVTESGRRPAPTKEPEGHSRARLVVVVGDVLLDIDITGSAERLSPEAPVPVVTHTTTTSRPGGAGLTALIAARGHDCDVSLITALGSDSHGRWLRRRLHELGIEIIDLAAAGTTPTKTRIRARDTTLLRIDDNGESLQLGNLPDLARQRMSGAAAIVVSDYGRGVTAHPQVRDALGNAARHVPIVWDPHPRGADPVPGVTLAVPSTDDFRTPASTSVGDGSIQAAVERARELLHSWPVAQVAITRGRHGAVLVQDSDGHPLAVPAHPAAGDTCGAGDAFAVTAALHLARGQLPSEAVTAAVAAASTYIADGGPVLADRAPRPATVTAPDDALTIAGRVRASGGRVVAAGGCFDMLHTGHLSLLTDARRLGDCLIVCLNSDDSVRRLKGLDRPVMDHHQRAALLHALECVDGVLGFEQDTPHAVLADLKPDIWVKGGDYTGGRVPEADLVQSWGGQVVVVPYLRGSSTTSIIERLRNTRVG